MCPSLRQRVSGRLPATLAAAAAEVLPALWAALELQDVALLAEEVGVGAGVDLSGWPHLFQAHRTLELLKHLGIGGVDDGGADSVVVGLLLLLLDLSRLLPPGSQLGFFGHQLLGRKKEGMVINLWKRLRMS